MNTFFKDLDEITAIIQQRERQEIPHLETELETACEIYNDVKDKGLSYLAARKQRPNSAAVNC